MAKLELEFSGTQSEEIAKKMYTYLVDGGLEDQLIDFLSTDDLEVSMDEWDNDTRKVTFNCTPIK